MYFDLPRREFTVSRGYTYSFVHIERTGDNPTLLLLHGWPSHIDDWIYQIRHFQSKGYGLVVPDMLGYGGSSNPSETTEYRLKPLSQDLVELLDHVGVRQVVGVGHDWGANILSRLAIYHPDRLRAVAFLGIGPSSPGTTFDLDAINAITKEATGTEMLGYISYITRDAASQRMMELHAQSVMDILFADDPKTWNAHFHPLQGFKSFVEEGRRQNVGSWYPPELQRRHLATFGREGGHLGPAQYYKMLDGNLSVGDEAGFEGAQLAMPSLLVVPGAPASSRQMHVQMLQAWAPGLEVAMVDSGHWVHLEQREAMNAAVEGFVQGANWDMSGSLLVDRRAR
ncbi:epoxide hydrolase [Apiospora rasikravindrae]|uniref:Epoxide hydrolase n=1 Tax=Apiospora rasikravindrae TaxID=990691 RepID=A0ABR1T220_9PEZI